MYRFSERKEPLYATIKRELLSKIERGTWPINHKLPSEDELQEHYDVSRGTIRRALSELELEGYITRVSGKGTFVTRVTPRYEKAMGEITSFTEQLSQAGFEPSTRVLLKGIIKASEAKGRVEEGFGIPADAEVIQIKRLREGNEIPYAIQSVYLLPKQCPGILEEDLTHLFKLYEAKYNRTMSTADELVRASGASPEEAGLLHINQGAPVLIRERVSYDQTGKPFEVLHSVDRGDRFEYRYIIVNDTSKVPGPSGNASSPREIEKMPDF
ncbi:MAG: GntR family transcriptional regulator [Deltaproteobacteria bacterium]|nr:MAG: GntR family transcriptional regulator [Deltaproteobacteria bacterium]